MASPALQEKIAWSGYIISVQPRIRLLRSFDQRHHSYQGYVSHTEEDWVDEEATSHRGPDE